MKSFVKFIVSILPSALLLVSCVDEKFYTDDYIPDGVSEFTATVDFKAFTPALETRAAGDAIKEINSLWLVIYEQDGNGAWKLEKDGKIEITAADHQLTTSIADNTRPDDVPQPDSQTETRTGRASFRLRHKNGQYKIYAVANCDTISKVEGTKIDTPEKLKSLQLTWDTKDIHKNAEMFGFFTNDKDKFGSDDESVTIGPNRELHAWIRRTASKVTVAFNGEGLHDGVSIYPLTVSIKDIPLHCPLGSDNTEPDVLIDGEMIKYYEGDTPPTDIGSIAGNGLVINKETSVNMSLHAETAPALYFYENMQGSGEDMPDKRQDANGDKTLDHPGLPGDDTYRLKDDVPYGTYIEVQAIWRSTNTERQGSGIVKYRFMLGKDVIKDYDAERNYHYKLTMNFKNFANDVDWHIDYREQTFEVSEPQPFNYQGKVFVPDKSWPNLKHEFSDTLTVTVASYIEGNDGTIQPVNYEILSGGEWLECKRIAPGDHPYEVKYKFTVKKDVLKPDKEIDINQELKAATSKSDDINKPYNLADPNGTPDNIVCTANCYMIDAPGWYIFPLVYGNAIHNGTVNESSYKSTGSSDDSFLSSFVNHLGNPITSPYIKENTGCNPQVACLVWMDTYDDLSNNPGGIIRPHFTWGGAADKIEESPKYMPNAYGGKGGIRFYVDPQRIKQGNAVIAICDKAPTTNSNAFYQFDAIWSWHIWVTRLDVKEKDKTIEVTAHDPSRKFEFMPMNLGWCSEDGEKIKYYEERVAEIKFSSGGKNETVKIVKKSHIAFTYGNNPYYQWGRKDPFIAAKKGEADNNKPWYNYAGVRDGRNPPRLTNDSPDYDSERLTTRQALGHLIRHPETWHNPPREWKKDETVTDRDYWRYFSKNESYSNLWEGRQGKDHTAQTLKTVYDPSPVGYQVCHYNAFSGFTTTGDNTGWEPEWYDVRTENIMSGNPTEGLYEFYTNPEKNQSIIFPMSSYRDWDSYAYIADTELMIIGYSWAAGNARNNDNYAYNFMFSRKDKNGYIRPKDSFYPTDGMPVRSVRNGSHTGY